MREEGIVDGLFWAPHVGQKRNRPLDEEIIIDFQDVCHSMVKSHGAHAIDDAQ